MRRIPQIIWMGALIAFVSSCAIHNTPDTALSIDSTKPNTVTKNKIYAFVDQNGSFYPENWESTYGSPCKLNCWQKHYSLLAFSKSKGADGVKHLKDEEERILNSIETELKNAGRVFIFVHGYNNDAEVSLGNYQRIRELIDFDDNDYVIEFFWDGLVSKLDLLGDAKIWFRATGYSQLAGAEGLRDILNRISNKEVFIISHSRGASVALSAMSNPPYGEKFAKDTLETHHVDVFASNELLNNINEIKLLLLAPAIGDMDFKKPSYYTDDKSYRDLGDQLVSISYTVNPNDSILKKILNKPNVSGKFNPTDFGYSFEAGESIRSHYKYVKYYDFSTSNGHEFGGYINNDNFKLMLTDAGIQIK